MVLTSAYWLRGKGRVLTYAYWLCGKGGGANICMANTGPLHPCQLGGVFVSGLIQFALGERNRIINYWMHHKMMFCCFDP